MVNESIDPLTAARIAGTGHAEAWSENDKKGEEE
jgi:hypothetical protein